MENFIKNITITLAIGLKFKKKLFLILNNWFCYDCWFLWDYVTHILENITRIFYFVTHFDKIIIGMFALNLYQAITDYILTFLLTFINIRNHLR